MILINKENHTIHLRNNHLSYVMEILDGKYILHRYIGKPLKDYHTNKEQFFFKRAYYIDASTSIQDASFDEMMLELPTDDNGDYRLPSLRIRKQNEEEYLQLLFKGCSVKKGKDSLEGLPSTYGDTDEVETLELVYEDYNAKIRVFSYYSLFKDRPIIARHQVIENLSDQSIVILDAKSLSLDLPKNKYDWFSLYGTYAKEANEQRFPLHYGIQKIESKTGSSSPQHQPFFALMQENANQFHGEIFGFQLIYSGNFIAQAQLDQFSTVRAQIGLNPETFQWILEPGKTFTTPEAILNYSSHGLNEMSQNFHWLYQYHLLPKKWKDKKRPILLNSWEAMYYDVSFEKIAKQVQLAKQIGIDLFVLDDGWFRSGNTSECGIGDWHCNKNKLTGGIQKVANYVHQKGLLFGLWFEPEAINKNSNLFKEHPEWVLHVPGYSILEGRHEYLLDLTNPEVRNYIISVLDSYLSQGWIDYVKWDMNRPLAQTYSNYLPKQKESELRHRYILGLYDLLHRITKKYPDVLFEGCSSGGCRFDPGILAYVGQNWCSDNTDGFDRVQIQSGFARLYPPISMSAHVSVTPNHQTGRITSFDTRFKVAKCFNLGYELDLTKLSKDELNLCKSEVEEYKSKVDLITTGIFSQYDTKDSNFKMWSLMNPEKTECTIMVFQEHYSPLTAHSFFKIPNLNISYTYLQQDTKETFGGDELKQIGFTLPVIKEDYHIYEIHFKKIGGENL